jgi:hypothetical protein
MKQIVDHRRPVQEPSRRDLRTIQSEAQLEEFLADLRAEVAKLIEHAEATVNKAALS